jgi:hypothetical protein
MHKTMSLKQLAANRRNALKSTGPKTVPGKAVSRLNAMKHGLLARQVVVRGHKLRESSHEFKKLCRDYYEHLMPVGPLEEMLVGQMATATWRLRRARTAETGEVALSVDTGWWQRENHNPLTRLLAMPPNPFSEGLVLRLKDTAWGCRYLIYCLGGVRDCVERDGELSEVALNDFNRWLREQAAHLGEKLTQFRAWLTTTPEKLEPEALRTRHREEVLKYLSGEIRNQEYRLEECEKRENCEEAARQAAAVLPSMQVLDKTLRYETALERQLYRAMDQLERLQRRRQGEDIPAPVTMEITGRG